MEVWQKEISIKRELFFIGKAFAKFRGSYDRPISAESGTEQFELASFYEIKIKQIEQISKNSFDELCKLESIPIKNFNQAITRADSEIYSLEPENLFIYKLNKKDLAHLQYDSEELHGYFESVSVAFKLPDYKTKIVCRQGFPTGKEEISEKFIKTEFYNEDCSTYWQKRDIIKVSTNTTTTTTTDPPSWDWLAILILIFIFFLIITVVIISKAYFLKVGLALILGIYFLINGIIKLFSFLRPVISGVVNFLQYIFSFGLIILFIIGLIQLIDNSTPEATHDVKHTHDDAEVNIDHEYLTDDDQSSGDITDNKPENLESYKISLNWSDNNKKRYSGTYRIYKRDLERSSQVLRNLQYNNVAGFGMVYSIINTNDNRLMSDFYKMIDSLKTVNKSDTLQFANMIVSLVQSLKYTLIIEENCESASVLNNPEISDLRRKGVECQGNRVFGLKTPVEYLVDLKGDCDSRTLLLYTIFKHYNFDVAIINSEYYQHSMLGLSLQNIHGANKVLNGKQYYFWETTSKGFKAGQLPRENGNLNYWKIAIN